MSTKSSKKDGQVTSYRDGVLSSFPEFEKPDFLDELDQAALEASNRDTLEGYLASFLIYQQLSEEMLRLIIKLGRMYIQLSALPLMISYKPLGEKLTFGNLIDKLDEIPLEDGRLKDLCIELNNLRAQLVHKITRKNNLSEIKKKCARAHILYAEIYREFDYIEDILKASIADLKEAVTPEEN